MLYIAHCPWPDQSTLEALLHCQVHLCDWSSEIRHFQGQESDNYVWSQTSSPRLGCALCWRPFTTRTVIIMQLLGIWYSVSLNTCITTENYWVDLPILKVDPCCTQFNVAPEYPVLTMDILHQSALQGRNKLSPRLLLYSVTTVSELSSCTHVQGVQ